MNYPLISEYIEAIKAAEDNFDKLTYLTPVLDNNGQPIMSSGNFAVVFKMEDSSNGKLYAVKCFLKEQEDRAESYRLISDELNFLQSSFLVTIKYLDKELFVDSNNASEEELPIVLMDWVEGETLDKYIRNDIHDKYQLSLLAYQFSRLSMWLLTQPFAHGDLKPDNIIVRNDGTLTLVDYDGMYVPAMRGQKARELGSPDFRHPSRAEDMFDEHIDDFSIASIMLSLKAIAVGPELLEEYGAEDRLLLSEEDYRDISRCQLINEVSSTEDLELRKLLGLFNIAIIEGNLSKISFRLFSLSLSQKEQLVIDSQIGIIDNYPESLAAAEINNQWGFVDSKGNEVIPFRFDYVESSFSEGLVAVKLKDKWGFIDKRGKEVIPFEYDYAYDFSEGLVAVELKDKWGFIDKRGKEVIPFKYEKVETKFSEGFVGVKLNDKWGFIDKKGKEVIPFEYDYANSFSEGLVAVKLKDKWAFVDSKGKKVITFEYDCACSFSEGLVAVKLKDKWGFIDKRGKEVIPFKYEKVETKFSEGFVGVKLNDKWGFIDKKGKEVTPFKYDRINSFQEGLASVAIYDNINSRETIYIVEGLSGYFCGFINKRGDEVIPLKYNTTGDFSKGLAIARDPFEVGFIDKKGNEVIPFKYDYAGNFSTDLKI